MMLSKGKIPLLILLAGGLVLASPALAGDGTTTATTSAAVAASRAPDGSVGCDDRATCGGEDVAVVSQPAGQNGVEACYRYYFLQWGSFWWFGDNNWHHYYRPLVCYNGSVITSRDQSSHWQETQGYYHPSGVSHHVVSGCNGCTRIQLEGVGIFRWSWAGADRSFSRCANLVVHGSGAWSGWYGC
jgi:hypothetical protein